MALRLTGGQVLWQGSGVSPVQPNTATISEFFMPTNVITSAATGVVTKQACFHQLNLGGTVDAVVIQGGFFIAAVAGGDRTITAGPTGSVIRAYAFGMPVINTAILPMTTPAAVQLVAGADGVAMNAVSGTASMLSCSSSLQLACRSLDQALVGEQTPLYAAASNDGYTTATCCQGLYVADGTVPAVNDQVNWAFSVGFRQNAIATAAITGSMSPFLYTSGLEKVWIAIKHTSIPTGGTTTMSGLTVSGRIYACFYEDIVRSFPTSIKSAGFNNIPNKDWVA